MNIPQIISFYFTGHFHCVQVLVIKNDAAMKIIMSFKHAYIHFCWLYSTSKIFRSTLRCYQFFFLLTYFNWRLVIILWWFLPYIDMNQLQVYMCPPFQPPLPPPSPSYISGSSQCTGFECPVSCIKLGLVIYFTYGNIHVSMLFS